jgi:hypothetical protein
MSSFVRSPRLSRLYCCSLSRCHRGYSSQALLARPLTSHIPAQRDDDSPMAGPSSQISQPQSGVVAIGDLKDVETPHAKQHRKQKKGKRLREEHGPRQNPLEPNTVDLHLASLRAAGLEPTLSDIDRCRPATHCHPESPQYAQDYRELCETLLRTFSREQLRRFGEMYGLDYKWTRSGRRKINYAEIIIEQAWKWPSLSEIEKQKMDRTQFDVKCRFCFSHRLFTFFFFENHFIVVFPVNPSQLFLILGRGMWTSVNLDAVLIGCRRCRPVTDVHEVQCTHVFDA